MGQTGMIAPRTNRSLHGRNLDPIRHRPVVSEFITHDPQIRLMTVPQVLYCGDTSLPTAAAYLAGLMTYWGWSFRYVPSHEELSESALSDNPSLFVISDYPASRIADALQRAIVEQVEAGAGLLMPGGWESFHGTGGNWEGTPIGNALPVVIRSSDDRVNCDGPVFLQACSGEHPVTRGLPWTTRPPLIGGFNRFTPKPEAQVAIAAVRYAASAGPEGIHLRETGRDSLLVTGTLGRGRTAALATDVAPHWIGPMVDWGEKRVSARAEGTDGIEVGDLYEQFFRQLLSWCAGL